MVHVPLPLVIVTTRVVSSIVQGPEVVKVGLLVEFDDAATTKVDQNGALDGAPVKLIVGTIAAATVTVSMTSGAAR